MRALLLLSLTLLLSGHASAFEPQIRIILPEKIISDLSSTTKLSPEIELTNRDDKPLSYGVYGPEDRPIWAGVISFDLRYEFGTKISPLWETMADHFGSRSLVLAPGASVTLRYRRPVSAQLRLAGNYSLRGSTRLVDETGKYQEVLVTPATFLLEGKPPETASPTISPSSQSSD